MEELCFLDSTINAAPAVFNAYATAQWLFDDNPKGTHGSQSDVKGKFRSNWLKQHRFGHCRRTTLK